MPHTPGPWKAESRNYGMARVLCGRRVIAGSITGEPDGEAMANARLIAAAPDLLAACKEAAQFITIGIEYGYIVTPQEGTREAWCLDVIHAAIAKARGDGATPSLSNRQPGEGN